MLDFRESCNAMMRFENPDLLVQLEQGYYPELRKRWKKEGMPDNEQTQSWETVGLSMGIAAYKRLPICTTFYPPFEEKVLEEDNRYKTFRNPHTGIVQKVFKHGPDISDTFPLFIKHPIQNKKDFERLKDRLDPHSPGRYPSDWKKRVKELEEQKNILIILGEVDISFFGHLRDWMGLTNLLLTYHDNPKFIKELNEYHLWFLKELYKKALDEAHFDFAFFWEDMAYKNGPLISPQFFREFMLPYYKKMTTYLRNNGIKWIWLDSDGDTEQLIPLFIEGGIDGHWPFECAAGMDIRRIRKKFPNLRILGGIDKREIAKGREAIDRELEKKLPFMFSKGGYFPSMDHWVPTDVSYDDFQYYLEKTRAIYFKCRREKK